MSNEVAAFNSFPELMNPKGNLLKPMFIKKRIDIIKTVILVMVFFFIH